MSSSNDTSSTVSNSAERLLGRVKWFNSKAGYGFITVTDGQRSGTDIFVHHSAVNVENQQYRYLVQGEYVEFSLVPTQGGSHEFQASAVCGIKSGKLMCETRREFKIARNNYRSSERPVSSTEKNVSSEQTQVQIEMPRQQRPTRNSNPRVRGNGPREENKAEWTLVTGKNVQGSGSNVSRPKRGRPSKQQQQTTSSA